MKTTCLTVMFCVAVAAAADKPILWKDPGPITSLNLAGGPRGSEMAPQPPFLFQEEESGGTTPKILVRDTNKRVWSVKFGDEAKAEALAARIAWAAGYFAEPTYFVREANLDSVGNLTRAAEYVDRANNNRIRDARFELRDPLLYKFAPSSSWSLDDAKLGEPQHVAGLKLLLMLLSNWDVKTDNTAVVTTDGQSWYAITDWGASMGRTGDITGRSKWDCEGYRKQSENFIDGVDGGYVTFNYDGKRSSVVSSNIRVEDVRWFAERMTALTDDQIRSVLEASGANALETACYATALRARLNQLASAGSNGGPRPATRTRTVTKTKTITERVQ